MENKEFIGLSLNATIAVITIVTIVTIGFPKGFAIKSPAGYKFDSRKDKGKKSAQ